MANCPRRILLGCWACAIVLVGVSCAEHPPTAIEDRSVPANDVLPDVRQSAVASKGEYSAQPGELIYIVEPGDTLYAVAFRLGLDYRTLARYNDIAPPYVIKVGQELRTRPTAVTELSGGRADVSTVPDSAPEATPATATATPTRADTDNAASEPSAAVPPANGRELGNYPVDRWFWPASGKVSRAYSEDFHKGIDLVGDKGDPVTATAAGTVVYAGTGVTGYGALLIVKHNEAFLSAYGHNDALLVAEGQRVEAGQVIARMGSSGADAVKLHFEIRRDGRPVNPTGLLPRRR